MDYHKILLELTRSDAKTAEGTPNIDEIASRVSPLLSDTSLAEIKAICNESGDTSPARYYLQTILHTLKRLHDDVLSNSETFMSVNEYRCVKVALETAISLGVFPCLLPSTSSQLRRLYPSAFTLNENLADLAKYNRLSTTIRTIMQIFDEISLKPAILTQLGPILAALIQLSHAPLMKPDPQKHPEKPDTQFQMTEELYQKLSSEQREFTQILTNTIKNCPQSAVIKELMVLLGFQKIPKWLRTAVMSHLIDLIMEPTGIHALITATCQDTIDVGIHWDRLETISKLIANNHGIDAKGYYSSICDQLILLLSSHSVKNSPEIARICIKQLYDVHPDICKTKIIDKICKPFTIPPGKQENQLSHRNENEISDSIENLSKLFSSTDAKFKSLPIDLIKEIALPLFCVYKKTYKSASILKLKSRELLVNLLTNSELRDELFAVFLRHENSPSNYGMNLEFQFGASGGLELSSDPEKNDDNDVADCLFNLVADSGDLPGHLFNYLQHFLSEAKETTNQRLEAPEDVMKRFENQLIVMKLLLTLADCKKVQEYQLRHPERLIAFIKSLFEKSTHAKDDEQIEEDHFEVLYVSLMLIKEIISEEKKPKEWSWAPFEDLSLFLRNKLNNWNCPEHLRLIIDEVMRLIKQKRVAPRFEDLSVDDKNKNDFDKALKDLTDPLLPVRAHGLISLTKLIDNSNPIALAKPDLLLYLFQENLKDDDSFVYLASVNGLCALALKFPQKVIEILIQEFIDMPGRNKNGEIAPENRAKLGEILVKTTRLLGEMAPAYKNILINGFLCATRDADPMVRASSLSCLGELCKVLGFAIGDAVIEVLYCISCIIETDKAEECRRAAVLVITLLIRGLGKDVLENLGSQLLPVYRALKSLRDNDGDSVLRLHAQLALEELDDIVKSFLFDAPQLEKRFFLLK